MKRFMCVLLAAFIAGFSLSFTGFSQQNPSKELAGKKFTVSWFDINGAHGKLRFHFSESETFIYEALPQGYKAYGKAIVNPRQGKVIRFVATTFRSSGAIDTHVTGVVVVKKNWLLFARGQIYSENGKASQEFYIRGKQD